MRSAVGFDLESKTAAVPFLHKETSNAVMGALLVHDICNPKSKAYASTKLGNEINLFKQGAFHGGVWRCGYKVGSIGEAAAVRFYLDHYGPTVSSVLVRSVWVGAHSDFIYLLGAYDFGGYDCFCGFLLWYQTLVLCVCVCA